MAQKPTKVLSSSSEHLGWSYPERGMGGRKVIAGGELCVSPNGAIYAMRRFDKNKLVGKYAEYLDADSLNKKKIFDRIPGSHTHGSGLYVLYDGTRIHYIGLTRKSLRWRLRTHLKDHLRGEWDHFSFYQIPKAKYVKDVETLFLRILQKTPGNKRGGKFRRRHNLGKIIAALGSKIS